VLYSGSIGAKQGLDVLLDAARRLATKASIKFVISGEGPAKGHLMNSAKDLQLRAPTLLIDGDLRDAGLTRSLADHADAGILEVIRGECALPDLLLLEPDSGLLVLPAVITKRLLYPGEGTWLVSLLPIIIK
jgi:glycosyltransferase involved in cell wall biosynthesis